MNSQAAPFEGIRVFDLSQGIAAPYSTMLMAAQGADVIKVEPPGGDWIRHAMNKVRGHPPAFIAVNVGKRSIVLDLKQPVAQGGTVPLTLVFEGKDGQRQSQELQAPVRALGAAAAPAAGHGKHGGH